MYEYWDSGNLIPWALITEFFFGSKTNNNIKIFMANL